MNSSTEYPDIDAQNEAARIRSEKTGKPFHETVSVRGMARAVEQTRSLLEPVERPNPDPKPDK